VTPSTPRTHTCLLVATIAPGLEIVSFVGMKRIYYTLFFGIFGRLEEAALLDAHLPYDASFKLSNSETRPD